MALPIQQKFRVQSPKGEIHSMPWANARDMVRNAGYIFVKGEKTVLKEAAEAAVKDSYIEGNDPRKIDVDALAKHYEEKEKPANIDEMTRDELIAFAETNELVIDKRNSRDKIIADIKTAQGIKAATAGDGDDDKED